jgi:GT2 family glycosyltransferase
VQILKKLPKVAVIILNYNGKKHLGNLLDDAIESALKQTYSNIEVVFADNGSADDSVEHVTKKYGDTIKVVSLGKNYGFCLGNNLALKHIDTNTKYLLFQNPDAVLSYKYSEELVSFMEENQTIGVAQGLEIMQDGRRVIGGLVNIFGVSLDVELEEADIVSLKSRKVRVLYADGSGMIVRKELFEKIGGFSSELFMYYDEMDLCCRLLCLGFQTVGILTTSYYHKLGGTVVSESEKMRAAGFMFRNRWLIIIRYFPRKFLLLGSVEFLAEFMIDTRRMRTQARLYFELFVYVIKNLRRELYIRNSYKKVQKNIVNYVITVPLLSMYNKVRVINFMKKNNLLSEKI